MPGHELKIIFADEVRYRLTDQLRGPVMVDQAAEGLVDVLEAQVRAYQRDAVKRGVHGCSEETDSIFLWIWLGPGHRVACPPYQQG
jgi:hypothetical protein